MLLIPEKYEFLCSLGSPTAVINQWIDEKLNEEIKNQIELKKCDEIISQMKIRKEEILKSVSKANKVVFENNELEHMRIKNLSELIKTPYDRWTGMKRQAAIEMGKFKNKSEMEAWVISIQEKRYYEERDKP